MNSIGCIIVSFLIISLIVKCPLTYCIDPVFKNFLLSHSNDKLKYKNSLNSNEYNTKRHGSFYKKNLNKISNNSMINEPNLITQYVKADIFFKNMLNNNIDNINQLIQRGVVSQKSSTITSIGYASILPIIIHRKMNYLVEIFKNNPSIINKKIDAFGNNLLHLLVAANWNEGIKYIKNNFKKSKIIEQKNNYGITPLDLAYAINEKDTLDVLKSFFKNSGTENFRNVMKVKDRDIRNLIGFDFITVFAIIGKNKEVLNAQYRNNKKLYFKEIDNLGNTALHIMAASNYVSGIKGILSISKSNDTVNKKNVNGFTPIHIAAAMNNYRCCDVLLDFENYNSKGINPKFGTPLHLAIRNYGLYTFEKQNSINTVWLLSNFRNQSGSFLNVRDSAGNTPLHLASMIGKNRFVIYLLVAGSDPRIQNNKNLYPFEVTGKSLYKVRQHINVLTELMDLESYKNGNQYNLSENSKNKRILDELTGEEGLANFCKRPY